jgi:hypothetical protein
MIARLTGAPGVEVDHPYRRGPVTAMIIRSSQPASVIATAGSFLRPRGPQMNQILAHRRGGNLPVLGIYDGVSGKPSSIQLVS